MTWGGPKGVGVHSIINLIYLEARLDADRGIIGNEAERGFLAFCVKHRPYFCLCLDDYDVVFLGLLGHGVRAL